MKIQYTTKDKLTLFFTTIILAMSMIFVLHHLKGGLEAILLGFAAAISSLGTTVQVLARELEKLRHEHEKSKKS